MAEDQGYRGPFAPTSPAPKQGFAHNEESSHERGKDLRESYGKKNEYANEKGFDDIERIEDELEGWLGTEIWRKRIRVTSMCRSRNSAICFSQFRISFSTFTRKLVKNARNCTTSFT